MKDKGWRIKKKMKQDERSAESDCVGRLCFFQHRDTEIPRDAIETRVLDKPVLEIA